MCTAVLVVVGNIFTKANVPAHRKHQKAPPFGGAGKPFGFDGKGFPHDFLMWASQPEEVTAC